MKTNLTAPKIPPIRLFPTPKSWETWLEKNHAKSSGLWLRLAKKDSGLKSITYFEALDIALCYGWIDSQKKGHDEISWIQRFTPRGPRSIWSKINRDKALEFIKSGQMKPAGLKAVENARQNGQWDAAYDPQSKTSVPEDFERELKKSKMAAAFFASLNSANRYAICAQGYGARRFWSAYAKPYDDGQTCGPFEPFHGGFYVQRGC